MTASRRASASASRALSLHPSALSDAEHALFSASWGELTDGADLDADTNAGTTTISTREARAWLCGRYADLGVGAVDEILRLFAPSSALSPGAFCAALRLALHARASPGRTVERSMAFVQAPVPIPPRINTSSTPGVGFGGTHNPFVSNATSLPTPAPSPEAPTRPPLPSRSRTVGPNATTRFPSDAASVTSSASASTSSSSASSRHGHGRSPTRKTSGHGYSASLSALAYSGPGPAPPGTVTNASSPNLPSPPVHPLRRAVTVTQPSSASSASGHPHTRPPSNSPPSSVIVGASSRNPFTRDQQQNARPASSTSGRPPPLPPRRASTSNTLPRLQSPFDMGSGSHPHPPLPTSASAYASAYSTSSTSSPFGDPASTQARGPPPVPPPLLPRTAPPTRSTFSPVSTSGSARAPPPVPRAGTNKVPVEAVGAGSPFDFDAFRASVEPPTPVEDPYADDGDYEDGYAYAYEPRSAYAGGGYTSAHARRVISGAPPSSSSAYSATVSAPTSPFRDRDRREEAALGSKPLVLPRTIRRTLAGAGWLPAERGEREGLLGS